MTGPPSSLRAVLRLRQRSAAAPAPVAAYGVRVPRSPALRVEHHGRRYGRTEPAWVRRERSRLSAALTEDLAMARAEGLAVCRSLERV